MGSFRSALVVHSNEACGDIEVDESFVSEPCMFVGSESNVHLLYVFPS